jgi:glycosyltransferase involved in cell wall biosynthesis
MHVAVLGIKALPATGGADRVVERLLEHAASETHYHVYLLRTPQIARHCALNLHYVYVPAWGGKHLRPFLYFLLCTAHVLVKGRYDVAHVHNSDFGFFCPLLRLKRGLHIVGTFHGDPYLRAKWSWAARAYLRLSEHCFVHFCDRLTSVSRFKASAQGLWSRCAIEYVPNGADGGEGAGGDGMDPGNSAGGGAPAPGPDWTALGVQPGQYLLFACGRLDATKGLHHLLAAYRDAQLRQKLLVLGDFSHDLEYSRRIEALCAGLPGVILHKQLLPRELLLPVVRGCRVFAFPSEVEAMSMMLLEAVSCRALVVCSDIPENLEVVGAGYRYAFSLQRPGDLSAKLVEALAEPQAAALTGSMYRDVMGRLSWRTIQERYELIYRSLCASRPLHPQPVAPGASA